MEYRTWTSVANIPFEDEAAWLPLTVHLEREHGDLGPVASWEEDGTLILILADEQPDPAAAAESAAHVVSKALHAVGLADRFPSVFQVEALSELLAA